VLWRALSFVGDDPGSGRDQTRFSGLTAGYLANVQPFFLAFLHVGSSDRLLGLGDFGYRSIALVDGLVRVGESPRVGIGDVNSAEGLAADFAR
jgi:hypothetical protein